MNVFDPLMDGKTLPEISDIQQQNISQVLSCKIVLDIPPDFFFLADDFHLADVELFPCDQKKIEPGKSVKKSHKKKKGNQNMPDLQFDLPVDFFCLDLPAFSPVRSLLGNESTILVLERGLNIGRQSYFLPSNRLMISGMT